MVDREGRDKLAEGLRHLASGRWTREQFKPLLKLFLRTRDDAVRTVIAVIKAHFEFHRDERVECTTEKQREIARWIVYLHTDLEYVGDRVPKVLQVLLIPQGIVFALLFAFTDKWLESLPPLTASWPRICSIIALVFSLLCCAIVVAVLFLLSLACNVSTNKKKNKAIKQAGYDDIWPFETVEDYEYALAHPRLLNGGNY